MTTSLGQQAVAIDAARRIMKGGKTKPRGSEMSMLDGQLADAAMTLRIFSENEAEIRAAVKGIALRKRAGEA